jgi:uncharacterized protein
MKYFIKLLVFLWHLPRNLIIGLIVVYQKLFSPDHSFWAKWGKRQELPVSWAGCKYYPSCSEYMKQSLKKYGLARGFLKGVWRICRCNPWSDGGVDLP